MKQLKRLKLMLFVSGLLYGSGVIAHPYDTALVFVKHKTDDGRIIYSNIPKSCFSKGLLTCGGIHPIHRSAGVVKNPDPESAMSDAATQSVPLSGDLSVKEN